MRLSNICNSTYLLTNLIIWANEWALGKSHTSSSGNYYYYCLEIIKRYLVDPTWTKRRRLKTLHQNRNFAKMIWWAMNFIVWNEEQKHFNLSWQIEKNFLNEKVPTREIYTWYGCCGHCWWPLMVPPLPNVLFLQTLNGYARDTNSSKYDSSMYKSKIIFISLLYQQVGRIS